MLRLFLFVAAWIAAAHSCPNPSFVLQFRGICTYFAEQGRHNYPTLHSDNVKLCSNYGAAYPVVIRNQEEQDYWLAIEKKSSYPLALGLRCNSTSTTWEWDDGSSVDYSPLGDSWSPKNCKEKTSWYMTSAGDWISNDKPNDSAYFELYCMQDLPVLIADDECGDFTDDSEDDVCYQVGIHAETWVDAQTVCKSFGANVASVHNAQENSYLRRLAVSRGLVNGIMLGATIMGKSDNFSWLDGTPWDYANFMNGFPIDGTGDCVAMDTNNVGGQWVNMQCSDQMSYACSKRTGSEYDGPACGDSVRSEGEIIYSPGFPSNSSIPCDFFLKVDTNKLVEVEILLLEANSCCDKLVLTEGSLGGSVIATLTGDAVKGGTKYRTKSSNVMRASWQPNDGLHVRGMMITFRGV